MVPPRGTTAPRPDPVVIATQPMAADVNVIDGQASYDYDYDYDYYYYSCCC